VHKGHSPFCRGFGVSPNTSYLLLSGQSPSTEGRKPHLGAKLAGRTLLTPMEPTPWRGYDS